MYLGENGLNCYGFTLYIYIYIIFSMNRLYYFVLAHKMSSYDEYAKYSTQFHV